MRYPRFIGRFRCRARATRDAKRIPAGFRSLHPRPSEAGMTTEQLQAGLRQLNRRMREFWEGRHE